MLSNQPRKISFLQSLICTVGLLGFTANSFALDQLVVEKYLTPSTVAGVRVNLKQASIESLAEWAGSNKLLPTEAESVKAQMMMATQLRQQLIDLGVNEVWMLIDMSYLMGGEFPFIFVMEEGKATSENKQQLTAMLEQFGQALPNAEVVDGGDHLVLGNRSNIEEAATLAAEESSPRTLPDSIAKANDESVLAFYAPSSDQRRALAETFPDQIPPFEKVRFQTLLGSIEWAAISLSQSDEISVAAEFVAKDERSGQDLTEQVKQLMDEATLMPMLNSEGLKLGPLLQKVKLETEATRVSTTMSESNGLLAEVAQTLASPMQAARGSARQAQSMNNMKQILLAMHNYHDVHKGLPPRYSTDEDGKPLLSWRVLILPYLEQQALYNAFHLDEPWDSEHNIKLAEMLVPVYASPGAEALAPGMTNYLVAAGEGMALADTDSRDFREFLDGLSNTIGIVEVDAKNAVPWSKPVDWEFDPSSPTKGLLDWDARVIVGIADGSIRTVSKELAADSWKRLLMINDGEVVDFGN